MPSSGSAELRALAVRLKTVGDRGLRLEMLRGIRAGAQPLIPAVREAAVRQLPRTGGLNQQVASQKIGVSVRTGARTAGVRLTTTAPDTAQTDAGFVRHPTFGRRGKGDWRTQQIPRAVGWWSKTLQRRSPEVTPQITLVMRRIAAQLQGR